MPLVDENPSAFSSVAIVVPMYNEIDSVPLLAYRLKSVIRILSDTMTAYLVIVDDGSTDMTYQEVKAHFGGLENVRLLRHGVNKGFSAALRTGVEHALELDVDLIVTIDADTNYDHFYIPMFLENFTHDCDIMTASPWHPQGQRKFFPKHRLMLSLTLSMLYRQVLKKYDQPLYTYSACFRVAKSDVYRLIHWEGASFMATSEILVRCVINGLRVKEFPFQVNPRWFGMSKMRKLKTIKSHLRFLWKIWHDPDHFLAPGTDALKATGALSEPGH
jgi:dolichol-phosphate mannosyltransferase